MDSQSNHPASSSSFQYSKQGEFKVCERHITMDDLSTALEENRVKEMFGSGTACVVCPVASILYKGQVRQMVLYPNLLPRAGEMARCWRHLSSRLRT